MGMKWYIARRIAWTVFAAWVTVTITFGIISASPKTGELAAAQQAALSGANPEEAVEDYRQARGLDRPIHERYIDYMKGLVTLNWGWSNEKSQFATTAIANAYPYSIQYVLPSVIITTILGYGLGIYSALHQGEWQDYFGTIVAFFGASIPNFWFAIMGILIAGVWFSDATIFGISLAPLKLPVFYDSNVPQQHGFISFENARQLILPIIVLSTSSLGFQMRYGRAQAVENAQKKFVKTAKAKGSSERRTMFKHVLRVALVPLTNVFVGTVFGLVLAGSVIIEVVFSIPGLGLLLYTAALNGDMPLVLGPTLIGAFLVILGNLVEDVLFTVLDPRVDYSDRY